MKGVSTEYLLLIQYLKKYQKLTALSVMNFIGCRETGSHTISFEKQSF